MAACPYRSLHPLQVGDAGQVLRYRASVEKDHRREAGISLLVPRKIELHPQLLAAGALVDDILL